MNRIHQVFLPGITVACHMSEVIRNFSRIANPEGKLKDENHGNKKRRKVTLSRLVVIENSGEYRGQCNSYCEAEQNRLE